MQSLYQCKAPSEEWAPQIQKPQTKGHASPSNELPPTPLEALLGELSLPAIFGLYYARGSENYYGSKLTIGGADPRFIASAKGEAALHWFGTVGVERSGGGTSIYGDDGGPWEWSVNLVRLEVSGDNERCALHHARFISIGRYHLTQTSAHAAHRRRHFLKG